MNVNAVNYRFLPITQSAVSGYEPEPKISDFEIHRELGAGSFGRVNLVVHRKTGAQYALKAIDKKVQSNIEEKSYFRREIEIMYKVHHPNVVKLYGHFEDNKYCYFLMEYMPRGNIYDFAIKDKRKRLPQEKVACLMRDLISAVYFLHKMSPPIIHRDIKPENVLLANDLTAKLTDFGWSNYICGYKRTTVCGTPVYLAPEIVNNRGHDERVDIWCIGVLLFELMTGNPPFEGQTIDALKVNILNMKIAWPRDINPDAKDLIARILRYNPADRLPIERIINHPFFTKYFPNPNKYLIKPDKSIQYKTFIVSRDDPRTWDPIIRPNPIPQSGFIKNVSSAIKNEISINKKILPRSRSGYNNTKVTNINSNNDKTEIEKLKKELREKDNKIFELENNGASRGNEANITDLENYYDELKMENYELKEKIKHYEKHLNEKRDFEGSEYIKEIRESVQGSNKANFNRLVNNLKTNIDQETRDNFNAIIKIKEREIERFKEDEKIRKEREKKKHTALINKYDKILTYKEKQNKEMKEKLANLEKQLNI